MSDAVVHTALDELVDADLVGGADPGTTASHATRCRRWSGWSGLSGLIGSTWWRNTTGGR